jgi:hypothetical protein
MAVVATGRCLDTIQEMGKYMRRISSSLVD